MSSQPWYRWFASDFRSKTAHLSFTESEAFRRLIDAYMMSKKPLPLNHAALCRLVSAQRPAERNAIKKVIREFFNEINGELHNSRCDTELKKQAEFQAIQSAKGRAGANSRWHSTGIAKPIANAIAQAIPEAWPGDSLSYPLNTPEYDASYTSDEIENGEALDTYLKNKTTTNSKGNGQWWKTNQGIEAKAAELGIWPKPGEDWPTLKSRCFNELNQRKA